MLDKLAIRFAATTRVSRDRLDWADRALHERREHWENLNEYYKRLRRNNG